MSEENKDNKATGGDNTQEEEENQDLEKQADDADDQQRSDEKKADDKKADKTFTQAELDEILKKRLGKEKSKWEKEKDLPEIEKLKKQNQELSEKTRERDIADDFAVGAEKHKAVNIPRLLKIYRADLEISDDGKIENLKEVLEKAKEEMPEFFPSKTPGGSDGAEGKKDTKLTYGQKVDAEFEKTGRKSAFKI